MTAHTPSDNTAIDAAHAKLMEIAVNRLGDTFAQFLAWPTMRCHLEALKGAADAVRDQAIADLERQLGRSPGSFRCPPAADAPTGGVVHHPPTPPGLYKALTAAERSVVEQVLGGVEKEIASINRESIAKLERRITRRKTPAERASLATFAPAETGFVGRTWEAGK